MTTDNLLTKISDVTVNGSIRYSLTLFQEQGLQFRYEGELSLTPSKPDDNNVGVNILSHSSKTTLGVSFDYDAVFIYKKANKI